ncbi:outer membrane protein assembly factor BamB family protein [Horticoccus sp. 23ND18S-11]|uniref:outer membrane protein assembly factor BamB family protein n=1 Tax=Horticoccus sp. 23ND18S-11 TaxID=3391832 RepID=UPI0039C9E318
MKTGYLLTAFSFTLAAAAADLNRNDQWPQWRGPLALGVSTTATPPTEWSETKNVKWKVAIPGSGTATPIVWGNRIFIQTAVVTDKKVEAPAAARTEAPPAAPAEGPAGKRKGGPRGGFGGGEKPANVVQFVVLCLDRGTGRTLWQKVVREQVPHEGHHQTHGFASGSPVTDGKMLYAYFGSRGLYAMDFDGNVKWEVDLGDQQTRMGFGEGTSPALAGDRLIINWDHEGEDFVVALDKATGKELWRKAREEKTSWATPVILEHEGVTQAVINAGVTRSYDVKTGAVIWECGGQTENVIPSVVSGHGLVFAMSGFRGNAVNAIKIGAKGNVAGTDAVVWTHNKGTPYVPSPLLLGNELYFFSANTARLSIFDARTGTRHVEAARIEGMTDVYASPVAANGKIYLTGRDGAFAVLKPGTTVEILAKNKLDDSFDATPVPVGKELLLRGQKHLYCIAETGS